MGFFSIYLSYNKLAISVSLKGVINMTEQQKIDKEKKENKKSILPKNIKTKIANGHINMLLGAGCSTPFIETLNNIEDEMNSGDDDTKKKAREDYYELIQTSLKITEGNILDKEVENFNCSKKNYEDFITFWYEKISQRELNIINKQINIFTTNFDMFLEKTCEDLEMPYNDGFSGRINPTFSIENFNKIQKFKSLQFDNTSDIPIFNIIKLHGSVSWMQKEKKEKEKIYFSTGKHIADLSERDITLDKKFEKIQVINPNSKKHTETVLHTTYASLLRRFTLELEKENSLLIVIGCSLKDTHIHTQINAVLRSNPTLTILFFSYEPYSKEEHSYLNEESFPNFFVLDKNSVPKGKQENEGKDFPFEEITSFFKNIPFEDEGKTNNEAT